MALRKKKSEPQPAPWQVDTGLIKGRFGSWEVPGLLPGEIMQLRRSEAREAAQARREEDERQAEIQDRADVRRQDAILRAQRHCAWYGLEFNPARPFEHMPTFHDVLAAEEAKDRRDREVEIAKLKAQIAGLEGQP